MGNSVNSSLRKIARQEKKKRALQLRSQGCTFNEISRTIACSLGEAHKLVTEGIQDIPREEAEAVRAIELRRLDRLWKGLAKKGAFAGDPRAVDSALRIMVRRAKLLGLDAPDKVELGGPNGGPITTKHATYDEVLGALARLAPGSGTSEADQKPEPEAGGAAEAHLGVLGTTEPA